MVILSIHNLQQAICSILIYRLPHAISSIIELIVDGNLYSWGSFETGEQSNIIDKPRQVVIGNVSNLAVGSNTIAAIKSKSHS